MFLIARHYLFTLRIIVCTIISEKSLLKSGHFKVDLAEEDLAEEDLAEEDLAEGQVMVAKGVSSDSDSPKVIVFAIKERHFKDKKYRLGAFQQAI